MKVLDREALAEFANQEIVRFHAARLAHLEKLSLNRVLKKKENRYLFGAKNFFVAGELMQAVLNAFLSFSAEELFGDFLEELAAFVSQQTCNGKLTTLFTSNPFWAYATAKREPQTKVSMSDSRGRLSGTFYRERATSTQTSSNP